MELNENDEDGHVERTVPVLGAGLCTLTLSRIIWDIGAYVVPVGAVGTTVVQY